MSFASKPKPRADRRTVYNHYTRLLQHPPLISMNKEGRFQTIGAKCLSAYQHPTNQPACGSTMNLSQSRGDIHGIDSPHALNSDFGTSNLSSALILYNFLDISFTIFWVNPRPCPNSRCVVRERRLGGHPAVVHPPLESQATFGQLQHLLGFVDPPHHRCHHHPGALDMTNHGKAPLP